MLLAVPRGAKGLNAEIKQIECVFGLSSFILINCSSFIKALLGIRISVSEWFVTKEVFVRMQ